MKEIIMYAKGWDGVGKLPGGGIGI